MIDKKKPDETKRTFLVAACWPREGGFGMPITLDTWKEVMNEVRNMQRLGYGMKGHPDNPIITVRACVEKVYRVPVVEPKET